MKIHGMEYFKIITYNCSSSGVWIETHKSNWNTLYFLQKYKSSIKMKHKKK